MTLARLPHGLEGISLFEHEVAFYLKGFNNNGSPQTYPNSFGTGQPPDLQDVYITQTPPQGISCEDAHEDLGEGDPFYGAIINVQRFGSTTGRYVNMMNNYKGFFQGTSGDPDFYYFHGTGFNADLNPGVNSQRPHPGAPVEIVGDHIYADGLGAHFKLTGDTASLTILELIAGEIHSYLTDPDDITAWDIDLLGYVGRGFGRQWLAALWAYRCNPTAQWRDLCTRMAGIAISPNNWREEYGCYVDFSFTPAVISAIYNERLGEALWQYGLIGTDLTYRKECHRRLIRMADFAYTYGLDNGNAFKGGSPPYYAAAYRYEIDTPAAGQVTLYPGYDVARPTTTDTIYSASWINILCRAARLTGKQHYRRHAEKCWLAMRYRSEGVIDVDEVGSWMDPKLDSSRNYKTFEGGASYAAAAFELFADSAYVRRKTGSDMEHYYDETVLADRTFISITPTRPAQASLSLDAGKYYHPEHQGANVPNGGTTIVTRAYPNGRSYSASPGTSMGGTSRTAHFAHFGGAHGSHPGNDVEVYRIHSNTYTQSYIPETPPPIAGQSFVATAGQTVFTFAYGLFDATLDVTVKKNSVLQTEGTHYNVVEGATSCTFTFTSGLTAGDVVLIEPVTDLAGFYQSGGTNHKSPLGRPHTCHLYDKGKFDGRRNRFLFIILGALWQYEDHETDPAQRLWTFLTTAPGGAAANETRFLSDYDPELGGYLYGVTVGAEKGLYFFNPDNDTFTSVASLPNPPFNGTAVEWFSRYVPSLRKHFFGAVDGSGLQLNPFYWLQVNRVAGTYAWTELSPSPPATFDWFTVDTANKKILAIKIGIPCILYVFDCDTETWSTPTVTGMPSATFGLDFSFCWEYDNINNLARLLLSSPGGSEVGGTDSSLLFYREANAAAEEEEEPALITNELPRAGVAILAGSYGRR